MAKKTLDYFIEKNLQYRPYFFSFIRPQEAFLFEKYKEYCKGMILDFGCGDGFFAECIFGKRRVDIGLDVITSRIKTAKKNNIYKKTVIYDGIHIPYKEASVQTIISNCVFEHIPHIKESLTEMKRVLKPGGHLVTSVMCNTWNGNLSGKRMFGSPYVAWFNRMQEHHALYSKKQWIALFAKCGFDVVAEEDYLYEIASQKTELSHFTSLYSLALYKLTGHWTCGLKPSQGEVEKIRNIIVNDKKNPSACFFVLRKKS